MGNALLRRWSVLFLVCGLLLPFASVVRADGPAVAPTTLPVGPGTLTAPRLSGQLLVWQAPEGVFGVDLATRQALPIPAAGASEPDVAGSLVVWKQGTVGIAGLDTATGTRFVVPVGDARAVFAPSVSAAGVVAWLAQDSGGIVVKVWDRASNAVAEAGRIPPERLMGETLGVPRVSGRRVVFPQLVADPARLNRFILFNLDNGQRLAVNDAFGGAPIFAYAENRVAVVQNTRIAIYDFSTNAVEAVPVGGGQNQRVTGIGFDGTTAVWTLSADASGVTSVRGYDLARHTGFLVATSRDNAVSPVVSGSTVVWSQGGGLAAQVVAFPDPAPAVAVRADYQYFPQTGYIVGYTFLSFWQTNGTSLIFGYPLTNDTIDPASKLVVQYFEKARFESHPEAANTAGVVQLTNVGRIVTAGRTEPPFSPQPLVPTGLDRAYFTQSQHALQGYFKTFWERNGGVAIFGYPISEEMVEPSPTDGQVYSVQYFERARFEFHPAFNDSPYAIELGQLGRQILAGQIGAYRPQCSPEFIQKPLLPECK